MSVDPCCADHPDPPYWCRLTPERAEEIFAPLRELSCDRGRGTTRPGAAAGREVPDA